jgi:glycosyltransferase involved in cell wall biosynthesis
METAQKETGKPVHVSIGIVARNEESGIAATLDSLFNQSIFGELNRRGLLCEIICLANGCTDRTEEVAAGIFESQMRQHPDRAAIRAGVSSLSRKGKINAWNQFVHALSARESQFIFLMDSDILIHRRETLLNMLRVLESDADAHIAVDRPCKHILFKPHKSLLDRISLATARLTTSAEAQLCGQLYCIRAEIARRIYLPKDLAACEDGFIKNLVCTDFLTRPVEPRRIRLAEDAAHTFEAYSSPWALVKNQKRQVMGQTIVHVLIDKYLKSHPLAERPRVAAILEENDRTDPGWLKRLIVQHLNRVRFWWRLYPGMTTVAFRRLRRRKFTERVACFLTAAAGASLTFISGWSAFGALKSGCTDYWPQARRRGFARTQPTL